MLSRRYITYGFGFSKIALTNNIYILTAIYFNGFLIHLSAVSVGDTINFMPHVKLTEIASVLIKITLKLIIKIKVFVKEPI